MSYKDQFKEVKMNRITINGKTIACLGTNVVINIRRTKMNTIVINLFGGSSTGKSTCVMDITAQLKRHGINAEYVSEFH